jgi:hypothetical protein
MGYALLDWFGLACQRFLIAIEVHCFEYSNIGWYCITSLQDDNVSRNDFGTT